MSGRLVDWNGTLPKSVGLRLAQGDVGVGVGIGVDDVDRADKPTELLLQQTPLDARRFALQSIEPRLLLSADVAVMDPELAAETSSDETAAVETQPELTESSAEESTGGATDDLSVDWESESTGELATVSGEDASQISSPSALAGTTELAVMHSRNVFIPDNLQGRAGADVVVPVVIDDGSGVQGAQFTIRYDPNVLEITDPNKITAGSLVPGSPTVLSNLNVLGEIQTALVSVEGISDTSLGSLIEIEFSVKPDAESGTTAIDLVFVELNEDLIEVSPVPMAGADETDGLMEITAPYSFDFVLPDDGDGGVVDAITFGDTLQTLVVDPGASVDLEVRARNADALGDEVFIRGFLLDFSDSNTNLLPPVAFAQNPLFPFADTDPSDNRVEGLTFSPVPASEDLFVGTVTIAAPADPGDYNLTLSAGSELQSPTDSLPPDVFNDLTIRIIGANTPPDAVDDPVTTPEDTPVTFNVLTNDMDADGDTISLVSVDTPLVGSVTDNGGGSLTYTPAENFAGEVMFGYTITDGTDTDSATVRVTVEPVNDAPVADSPGRQTVAEETQLLLSLTATDVEDDDIVFSLVTGPVGLVIAPDGTLTWTPTEAQGPGFFSVTFGATDDGDPPGSDEVTFLVEVTEVNTAPVLGPIGDQTVDEETELSFGLTSTDVDDPPNGRTFSATGLPQGAALDPDTGVFTWTPTEAQGPGMYPITFIVMDDGDPVLEDSESIVITVNEVNKAPVLDPIGPQQGQEGSELSFTLTASDDDLPANMLTFAATGLPAGAVLDPVTGVFSWVPDESQGGMTFETRFIVMDDGAPILTDFENVTIEIAEVNQPPVLDPIGDRSVDEGTELSFTLSASDPDLPANGLTFSVIDAPEGSTLDAATGLFTWTPSEAQGPDTFEVTFTVTDDGVLELSDSETITITVNEVNEAPILDPIGNLMVAEETELSVTLTATDPDIPANALTFSATGLPDGAQLDPVSGLFTWTPTEEQGPGSFGVTFIVTDNGAPAMSDSEDVNIIVQEVADPNQPPVIDPIDDQSVNEGEELIVVASATDPNDPPDNLTFSLGDAPTGATIDPVSGELRWTPSEDQGPGLFNVTVVVTDDGLPPRSAETSFNVTVSEVNQAPILAPIGDQMVDEGTELSFVVSASDPDLPANGLIFEATGLPDGATFDTGTRTFSWTPTEAQGPGMFDVTFTVSDDGDPVLRDSETITITVVEVNEAPVLAPIGDQAVDEGTELSFVVSASDPDLPANALTLEATGLPDGATFDAATGLFSWTPTEVQGPGMFDVTFTVTDDGDPLKFDEETITITVNEVNTAPVVDDIADQEVDEGSEVAFVVTASDADVPANVLTLSASPLLGSNFNPATGEFSWTPLEDQGPGVFFVTFTATDDGVPVLMDTETVQITVNEVNVAPVLDPIGDQAVDEGTELMLVVTASDADVPANALTLSATGLPSGASFDPLTGTFTWTPSEEQGPGMFDVTFTVMDDGTPELSDSETITITVSEVNLSPVLDPVGDQSVDEGSTLSFTLTASDPDIPANALMFSANLPVGATLDPSTGVFEWTPTEAQGPGTFEVTLTVTDDGTPNLADSETITITVAEVNEPPVLAPIGDQMVDEGTELSFVVSASDPDLPANGLIFEATGLPDGATFDTGTRTFSWTPTEAQGPGMFDVTFTVSDDGDPVLRDSETITITVGDVNVPPVLDPIGDQTVDEGTELLFVVSATDGDLPPDTLTFEAMGLPDGATFDAATGQFSWTPTEAQGPGMFDVTFTVTDDGDPPQFDMELITITVNEVNLAPVVDPIPDQEVNEGNELMFTATATDADLPANTLTFSLDGAPAGAEIDPTSGLFRWTPSEVQGPGVFFVSVVVTDDGVPEESAVTTVRITVNEVNVAPVLNPIGDQSVDEGAELAFQVSATDADEPPNTLQFSLVDAPAGASIDPDTGSFTWTPDESQGPAEYDLTVIVTDDGVPPLSDSETIRITVGEVNTPPTIDPIADAVIDEQTTLSFTATAADADLPANTLVFSLEAGAPAGASIDPNTGEFTWTPSEAQGPGDFTITVTVTDDGSPNLSASTSFNVTVEEVNIAPSLDAIDDQTVDEGVLLALMPSATDPDLPANVLTFSLTSGPDGATVDPVTGEFQWTPTEEQGPGEYRAVILVEDNGDPRLSESVEFNITVREVNTAPILAPIGDQVVDEENPLTFTAAATDADLPAEGLTFSIEGAPAAASFDALTGVFEWTPTEADGPAVVTVTVRVTDDGDPNLSDEETFSITVNEVNTAPTIDPIPSQTVRQDEVLRVQASASDSDLPPNALTFSLVDPPPGATIDPITGEIEWLPGDFPIGPTTLTVMVTDDGVPPLSATTTFDVEVLEPNFPPVAFDDEASSDNSDPIEIDVLTNDSDPDGDPLTVAAVGAPNYGTAEIGDGGVSVVYTPASDFNGTDSFSYDVSDGRGGIATAIVRVTVITDDLDLGTGVIIGQDVFIADGVSIGDNVVLGNGVVIGAGTTIGDNVILGDNVTVGADSEIGDNVQIGDDSMIGGDAAITALVTASTTSTATVTVTSTSTSTSSPQTNTSGVSIGRDTTLGTAVIIGGGTDVDRDVTVGDDVHIGAESDIARDVTIGSHSRLGNGVVVGREAWIGTSVFIGDAVVIGREVTVQDGATIARRAALDRHAVVGAGADVGSGVQIQRNVSLGRGVSIGEGTFVGKLTTIGADTQIGSDTFIGKMGTIGERVTIGDNVFIADRIMIADDSVIPDGETVKDENGKRTESQGEDTGLDTDEENGDDGADPAPAIEGQDGEDSGAGASGSAGGESDGDGGSGGSDNNKPRDSKPGRKVGEAPLPTDEAPLVLAGDIQELLRRLFGRPGGGRQ